MRLEIVAEVQHRPLEHLRMAQQERNEQPPNPAVAVQERMDGFELRMSQRADDERIQAAGVMKEPLEVAEGDVHLVRRRRDKGRIG